MVVPAGTGADPVLDQRGASGRAVFGMEFELCQQGLALLALVPIWLYRGRQGCHSKPFQYACYAFYPVHMLLLVLALNFVNR